MNNRFKHMTEDNFLSFLIEEANDLRKDHYFDPSVEKYNKLRKCIRTIAQIMLVRKAYSGKLEAIIQLDKSYADIPLVPKEKLNIKTLSEIEDITPEHFGQLLYRMKLIKDPLKIDNFKPDKILEGIEKNLLTKEEANNLFDLYIKYKKCINPDDIQSNPFVVVTPETYHAITSDSKESS